MSKTDKKLKFERLMEIRKKYEQFIEADRRRKARNDHIIDKLHNIKNNWLSTRCQYPSIRESDSQINHSGKTRVDLLAELGKSQNRTPALLEPVTNFGERGFQNLILTELSKHYILIPKQNANSDPARNKNNAESYLVSSKQSAEDWKSKYDILKNLENNELEKKNKQTSGTKSNNIVHKDIDITYSDLKAEAETSIGHNIGTNEHMGNLGLQSSRITTARIFDNPMSDHIPSDVTKLDYFPESQFHRENAMREISNVIVNENNSFNDRRISGKKEIEYRAASQAQQNVMPRIKSHFEDNIIDTENVGYNTVVPSFKIESMQQHVDSAQKLPQHYDIIPHEKENSFRQRYYEHPHQNYMVPLPDNDLPEQRSDSAQEKDPPSSRMPSSANIQLDVQKILAQKMYPPQRPSNISHTNMKLGEYYDEAEDAEHQNIQSLCVIEVMEKESANSAEDSEDRTHINDDKNRILQTQNEVISEESIEYLNKMSEVLLNTNIKSDSENKLNPISNDEKDVKISNDHKNYDTVETKRITEEDPEKEHSFKQSEEKFDPQIDRNEATNQDVFDPVNYIVGQDDMMVKEYSNEQQNYQNLEADLDQDLNQTYDPNYHEQYAPASTDQQYEQIKFEQNQYVTNQTEPLQYEQNQDDTHQYDQNQYEQNQVVLNAYDKNQDEQYQYERIHSEPEKTAQSQEGEYQYEQTVVEPNQYGEYQNEPYPVEQYQYEQIQDKQYQNQQNQDGHNQYEQNQDGQNQYEQNQNEHYQYNEQIAQNQYDQSQTEQYQSEQNQYDPIQLAQHQDVQPQYEQNQYEQTQQHQFYGEQQDPTLEEGVYEEVHGAYTAQMNSDVTFEDKLYEELHGAYTAQMNLTPQNGSDGQLLNQPHNKALLEKAGFEPESHTDDAREQLQYQQQGDFVNQQDTYMQSAQEFGPDEATATKQSPQKDGAI